MNNWKSILTKVKEGLPFEIQSAELSGDQLILQGREWTIVLGSSWWRLSRGGIFLCGSTSPETYIINDLIGLKIIEVFPQSVFINADLAFTLSNGFVLETFSTNSLDPWSITLGDITFFANPSDPIWVN